MRCYNITFIIKYTLKSRRTILRKLLLNSTALATALAITSNAAIADISISADSSWTYLSRSSQVTANDGTTFGTDSEIKFSFTNKTDSGLTIGYVVELESDDTDTAINESSLSIAGGFGKLVIGENDSVADDYAISADDLAGESEAPTVASASIGTSTDIELSDGDSNKVSYHLPAMGGFTGGASFTDSGTNTGTDTTSFGFNYEVEAGGNTLTLGASTSTTEATTTDTDAQIIGLKVKSGNLTIVASQTAYEAVDEDIETTGAGVSYEMANGMVLAAYTMKSEDDLDAGEEYTKSGVELQYNIANGLTAFINIDDYEYKAATNPDSDGTSVVDSGTASKLTIAASF
jgi:outer membrane protein OmpU